MTLPETKIGIVGAGVAGLILADQLTKKGADVIVFEKSRGIGGRMATRRTAIGPFSHGAPYFTARSKAFRSFLRPFIDQGDLAAWEPKMVSLENGKPSYKRLWFEPHYRDPKGMNAWLIGLSQAFDIRFQTKIQRLLPTSKTHTSLLDEHGHAHGPYDLVFITSPLPQARELLANARLLKPHFQDNLQVTPRWTLMLGFKAPLPVNWEIATFTPDAIFDQAIRQAQDPSTGADRWVLHTKSSFARANLDTDKAALLTDLTQKACMELGVGKDITPIHADLHRWRFAKAILEKPKKRFHLNDPPVIGLCGDGFGHGTVEAAFQSAKDLADILC